LENIIAEISSSSEDIVGKSGLIWRNRAAKSCIHAGLPLPSAFAAFRVVDFQ
jgi:hypothetical protein